MGRLVHTGLGSSSLVAHVLHYPPPPTRTALFIGTAVLNTHTQINKKNTCTRHPANCPQKSPPPPPRILNFFVKCCSRLTGQGQAPTCNIKNHRTIPQLHELLSRMRAGPMFRATFWSSKLSTPRSRRHWLCIVAILRSRSFTQAGPRIIATQPARNALPRRDLGF